MQIKETSLNIRIQNSSLHLNESLRKLTDTWGLSEIKGNFPHEFNHFFNYTYVGFYPDKKYYEYYRMNFKERKEFNDWYSTTDGKIFNFRNELTLYCRQDVVFFNEACTKYKELMTKLFDINPWRYLTIAQASKGLYHAKFMEKDTIAVNLEHVPQTSLNARQWLYSLDDKDDIQHAYLPEEKKYICGRRVDGYNPRTNTVYQFHGCYWQGCSQFFNSST